MSSSTISRARLRDRTPGPALHHVGRSASPGGAGTQLAPRLRRSRGTTHLDCARDVRPVVRRARRVPAHPLGERRLGARCRYGSSRPLGCRLHHCCRWDGGGRRLGGAAARDRRDRRHDRRRGGADGALLRPFRRSAARAARAVGERAVRAGDPWGVPVRPRDGRRQGAALYVALGGARARGCRRAAGERPVLLRRRGGDRRPLDRRLPRRGRAWGGRGDHLRQRHDPARAAGVQPGDARDGLLPPEAADRRRRPALGRVRRRRSECRACSVAC